jgi:hypothetical protein
MYIGPGAMNEHEKNGTMQKQIKYKLINVYKCGEAKMIRCGVLRGKFLTSTFFFTIK